MNWTQTENGGITFIGILIFLATIMALIMAGPPREPKPKKEANWTKAGEAIGQRTGRLARGFVKGAKNSDDEK